MSGSTSALPAATRGPTTPIDGARARHQVLPRSLGQIGESASARNIGRGNARAVSQRPVGAGREQQVADDAVASAARGDQRGIARVVLHDRDLRLRQQRLHGFLDARWPLQSAAAYRRAALRRSIRAPSSSSRAITAAWP